MRRDFLTCLLVIGIGWASPSAAQPAPEIPLTYDAFKGLTAEQAARRLLGPSSSLISKMIIGGPPGFPGAPLAVVRFFSTPRGAQAGLCQQNEIDVRFEREGASVGPANGSTRMKISDLRSEYSYFVVGDMAGDFGEPQRRALNQMCAGLDQPLAFFPAGSTREAWEGAYLADVALKEARSRGSQSQNIICKARGCDDAYASLTKLSSNDIFAIKQGCNHPPDGDVCYSISFGDPLNSYRSWLVYVESSRRSGAGRGPEVTFKNAIFTLSPQPAI